jgi:diguanylate cyclase (GGDEF)-like protein
MRIRNTPPPNAARVSGPRPVSRPARAGAATPVATVEGDARIQGAKPVDQATFLGLSEAELSPNVKAALMALLDEVARLREELEHTRKRIQHLERVADEDAMLPIANRRAFVRELSRVISYSERYGTPGSVLYFDLNGMKNINDRYGHPAGDEALRHFAQILVENTRDSDTVGRIGGDEFGVILAQADEAQAREKAESLVTVLAATPMRWEGHAIPLSCAIGLHQFTGKHSADEALSKADANMYDEKRKFYAKRMANE